MHSRIIELKLDKDTPSQLDTDLIPEWFTNYADYWFESDDIEGDIKWFLEYLGRSGITYDLDEKNITLTKDSPLSFFKDEYESWLANLETLTNMTLEQFADTATIEHEGATFTDFTCRKAMACLNSDYDDKYGFWVYTENDGLMTLMTFMRLIKYYLTESSEVKFYIGNTLDYHS